MLICPSSALAGEETLNQELQATADRLQDTLPAEAHQRWQLIGKVDLPASDGPRADDWERLREEAQLERRQKPS
jgi:hypothetical protein